MGTTQGFRYFNQDGDECPISVINLMTISKSEFEAAEQFLSDASQKLKSVVVCRQVAEHVKTGINSIRKSSGDGDTSKARKLTIRLVSSHGLEHFTSSVPLRYKASEEGQDPIERDICDTLKSWPFNVFINICTWISPTNLRKLAASNNIKHFAEWCLSPPILLQNQKIPVDVSDRGFSLFGETPMWPLFYQEYQNYARSTACSEPQIRELSPPIIDALPEEKRRSRRTSTKDRRSESGRKRKASSRKATTRNASIPLDDQQDIRSPASSPSYPTPQNTTPDLSPPPTLWSMAGSPNQVDQDGGYGQVEPDSSWDSETQSWLLHQTFSTMKPHYLAHPPYTEATIPHPDCVPAVQYNQIAVPQDMIPDPDFQTFRALSHTPYEGSVAMYDGNYTRLTDEEMMYLNWRRSRTSGMNSVSHDKILP